MANVWHTWDKLKSCQFQPFLCGFPALRCHPGLLTPPISSSLINLSSSLAFGSVLGRDWSGVAGEEIICSVKGTPGVLDIITCLPSHPTWQTSGKGCFRASLGALLQPHVLAALFTSAKPSAFVIPALKSVQVPFLLPSVLWHLPLFIKPLKRFSFLVFKELIYLACVVFYFYHSWVVSFMQDCICSPVTLILRSNRDRKTHWYGIKKQCTPKDDMEVY